MEEGLTEGTRLEESQILEDTKPKPNENMTQEEKITIRLVSIGSTPSISPNVLKISRDHNIGIISQYLRKKLKTKSVHIYIQNTFEPGANESIYDLFRLFKVKNELIVSYCLQVAFG